jgi:hypothetical protein
MFCPITRLLTRENKPETQIIFAFSYTAIDHLEDKEVATWRTSSVVENGEDDARRGSWFNFQLKTEIERYRVIVNCMKKIATHNVKPVCKCK